MSKLKDFVKKINAIEEDLKLDLTDLRLLEYAEMHWKEGRDVRVTDFVRANAASPATVHYRIAKDLVDRKFVKLKLNPEDAREKFVIRGSKFDELEKYL